MLVALYKAEGIAKVREVTGKPKVPDEARKAVQALHDYYVGEGVQYDGVKLPPGNQDVQLCIGLLQFMLLTQKRH